MTTVAMPVALAIAAQVWGVRNYDSSFSNADTGSMQVGVFGPPRWKCSLTSEERIPQPADAALWRATILSMRGQVNCMAVYDRLRPQPRGTARGAWTAVGALAGAAQISINAGVGQAGKTLLQGDRIGVAQDSDDRQLLSVQADAVVGVDGVLVVTIEPVLRRALVAGSVVVWDRPTCRMRRTTNDAQWDTKGSGEGGFSLDLLESWE